MVRPSWLLILAAFAGGCRSESEAPPRAARPNVLLIVVDDLRAEIGAFGVDRAQTPRIDAFAGTAMRFTRAYCQQALCNPSRVSFLTGLRPRTTGIYDVDRHFRDALPDVVTLPQHFKANGYRTASFGKVFHGNLLDPPSWSEDAFLGDRKSIYALEANKAINRPRKKGPPVESADVDDSAYRDGQVTDAAIAALQRLAGEPFFLAVGFHKPHLPFAAPSQYWDRYSPESVGLAAHPERPTGAPDLAFHEWYELRRYLGVPAEGPLADDAARELVHGYLACVSYVDEQVGRVLDELTRLDLDDDTLVVLMGDHGWYLGEHGLWTKMGAFEEALRTPVVVRAPGMPRPGVASDALVELVDLFPTLCDLAGLEAPGGLEGTSFAPLLDEPGRPWKRAAFSLHAVGDAHVGFHFFGRSIRSERWRFTSWQRASDGAEVAVELYDEERDPFETQNLAELEEHAGRVGELRQALSAGWRAALPE